MNALPLAGEVLGARGRGVVGRRDDGDATRTGGSTVKRGDVLSVSATYDSQARLVVRVDGDHAAWYAAGATRAASTRSRGQVERRGRAHARPPAGERQPRRRARRAARRAHAARRPGARRPARRSPTSSTARATCCAAGAASRPPVVAPGQSLTFRNRDAGAARSTTRSPPARRPATARRASPTRSPTGPSTSTPASSASARGLRHRRGQPRHVGDADEPRARAPTRTSAACTRSCAGRSGSKS